MKVKFSINDISYEHIDFCDSYIKKVITNAKRYTYREKAKVKKYNIILLNLETQSECFKFEEKGFENVFTTYITINKTIIPIHNLDLAEALMELTDIQRETVLRSIVLGDKLKDIAKDVGVSVPMISKHRKRALEIIKQRMSIKK